MKKKLGILRTTVHTSKVIITYISIATYQKTVVYF